MHLLKVNNYFAVGNSGECFSLIQDWVEKKVRRHVMKAQLSARVREVVQQAPEKYYEHRQN